jgi:hypothetical protein
MSNWISINEDLSCLVVEAGGVEPIQAVENTQVADFGIPLIPLTPQFQSTFAQFCTIVPPEGLHPITGH